MDKLLERLENIIEVLEVQVSGVSMLTDEGFTSFEHGNMNKSPGYCFIALWKPRIYKSLLFFDVPKNSYQSSYAVKLVMLQNFYIRTQTEIFEET